MTEAEHTPRSAAVREPGGPFNHDQNDDPTPCDVCGATDPCGYDGERRPMIHIEPGEE